MNGVRRIDKRKEIVFKNADILPIVTAFVFMMD